MDIFKSKFVNVNDKIQLGLFLLGWEWVNGSAISGDESVWFLKSNNNFWLYQGDDGAWRVWLRRDEEPELNGDYLRELQWKWGEFGSWSLADWLVATRTVSDYRLVNRWAYRILEGVTDSSFGECGYYVPDVLEEIERFDRDVFRCRSRHVHKGDLMVASHDRIETSFWNSGKITFATGKGTNLRKAFDVGGVGVPDKGVVVIRCSKRAERVVVSEYYRDNWVVEFGDQYWKELPDDLRRKRESKAIREVMDELIPGRVVVIVDVPRFVNLGFKIRSEKTSWVDEYKRGGVSCSYLWENVYRAASHVVLGFVCRDGKYRMSPGGFPVLESDADNADHLVGARNIAKPNRPARLRKIKTDQLVESRLEIADERAIVWRPKVREAACELRKEELEMSDSGKIIVCVEGVDTLDLVKTVWGYLSDFKCFYSDHTDTLYYSDWDEKKDPKRNQVSLWQVKPYCPSINNRKISEMLLERFLWVASSGVAVPAPLYLLDELIHNAPRFPSIAQFGSEAKTYLAVPGDSVSLGEATVEQRGLFDDISLDQWDVKYLREFKPESGKIYYLDTETSGPGKDGALDPNKNTIELVQLNDGDQIRLLSARGATEGELIDFFKALYSGNLIIGHNLGFDVTTVYAKTGLLPERIYDTMWAEVMIENATEERPHRRSVLIGKSLRDVVAKHLDIQMDKDMQVSNWAAQQWSYEQLQYAHRDVEYLPELVKRQVYLLNSWTVSGYDDPWLDLDNRVFWLEMAVLREALCKMIVNGVPINYDYVCEQITESHKKELVANEAFQHRYPAVTKIRSNDQVKKALRLDGADVENTQEKYLKQFYSDTNHEGVKLLINCKKESQVYRNLKKYKSSVLYPQWKLIGAPAGRMATSKPTVQNIPRRIKNNFYDPTKLLIRADYPAIELRICAAYNGVQSLIDAFNGGVDTHKLTASRVLGVDISEITKEQRQLAKGLNYGLIYGMGAYRLWESLRDDYGVDLTLEEAESHRASFFTAYPEIKRWHYATSGELRDHGGKMVYTMFGRQVWYPEEEYTNALNGAIQGTGADMLKMAVAYLVRELPELGDTRLVSLIHDEIIIESEMSYLVGASKALKDSMEKAAKNLLPDIETPVDVEVQIDGEFIMLDDYLEAKKG